MIERTSRVGSHEDLQVWHRSVALAKEVYKATQAMPRDEIFGLTSQIRRASVSVATNIAEGSGRSSTRDLLHFLDISRGSLREVQTLLVLIQGIGFPVETEHCMQLSEEVGRMLSALIRSLRQKCSV